jgi:WXXGXW repeat (2 copies)
MNARNFTRAILLLVIVAAYPAAARAGFFDVGVSVGFAPQPGLLWTPGYWSDEDEDFVWHAGYWGPHGLNGLLRIFEDTLPPR